MRRLRTTLVCLVAATFAATVIGAAPIEEIRPVKALERSAETFDRAAWTSEMADLHDRLATMRVGVALLRPHVVRVDPRSLTGIERGNARQQKIRIGAAEEISISVDFSDLVLRTISRAPFLRPFGAMRGTGDGGFVWTGVVRSVGAAALRVHIEDFDLPAGSELYIYTREGMAFGPYTGKGPNGNGDFWTNTVEGEELILQIHHEGVRNGGDPGFRISEVGHLTEKFPLAGRLNPLSTNTKPCHYNEDCTADVACVNESSAVDTAKDAAASIIFASGRWLYLCSGGLIADSDTTTAIPYFITANHCVSKGGEANSLETYFFYASSQCQQCTDRGNPSTLGSSILSTSKTSDYTLLQLSQPAPTGAAFLGWNANEVAFTHGESLYRISHPRGAPQAYSEHDVDTSKPTCRSWPRGAWIYSQDIFGATEGGSSGSPVVNVAGELVGQLSGACGFNVNDPCDSNNNATVDGAFAAYYSEVAQYLGPGDGGGDGGGDGDDDPIDGFSLSASGYKVRGINHADLSWSGATSTNVDVHRDGTVITTTANSGSYTDNTGLRGGGSFSYQVCEAGTSICSNIATVTF